MRARACLHRVLAASRRAREAHLAGPCPRDAAFCVRLQRSSPDVRCAPCGERGVKPHQAAAAACGSRRARAPTPPAAAGAIRTAFEFFSQRAATGFAVPEWAPTPGNAAYAAAVRRLDRAVYGVIDRRAAELAAAPGPPQARPQGVVGATVKADPGPRRRRMSRNRKPEAGRAGR